jgi:hypothetical protein
VHNLVVGVIRTDGRLVAADSWEWFRRDAALEGGALFRAQVADALGDAGWVIRSGTGDRGRYFEVRGVPESLCEVFSPRSREVADARAEIERELGIRLHGGALAVLAKETRQAKDHHLDPGRLHEVWDALGEEHGFGPGRGSRLRGRHRRPGGLEARMAQARAVVLGRLAEQGPTVSLARARALVYEAAAGRLSAEESAQLLARMGSADGGELLALAGGRVTSREIRQLERHVIDVAIRAAARQGDAAVGRFEREAGVQAAEAALGEGKRLDGEQRDAFEVLTSGCGWACLTGRAGTGKGPVLHAAAEAYRAAGWRVIACAMDGTTARRMAEQLAGTTPALTVEQLKVRLEAGAIKLDDRTVIFVDEASKLDAGHWGELAAAIERHGASLRAVGHDGQHDAIRLPGLFSAMLAEPRIPTAELRKIRRHRNPANPAKEHPWLRDNQVAVDLGRGSDAVAILQEHRALRLYDTRAQAIAGMVGEWDTWRRAYEPTGSALIVHGPNHDVDLINQLAQHKRLEAGELGERAIRAVDRDYLLRPGDLVAVRNAAYTFPANPRGRRPKRLENGQAAIVQSVDPRRDTLTLLVREPGAQPRVVEIDQSRLRAEHAACERAATVRLNYALHSFPAQGATVQGTATLAGHWSQGNQETYVGDTRAVYRHSVHLARADLGLAGTDEDRIGRYAQRISQNRKRQASIRLALDPTVRPSVRLPDRPPVPNRASACGGLGPREATVKSTPSLCDPPPTHAQPDPLSSETAREPPIRPDPEPWHADPVDHGDRAHGSSPQDAIAHGASPAERVARERAERETLRLRGLRPHGRPQPQAATPPPAVPTSRHEPTAPAARWHGTAGPTVRR